VDLAPPPASPSVPRLPSSLSAEVRPSTNGSIQAPVITISTSTQTDPPSTMDTSSVVRLKGVEEGGGLAPRYFIETRSGRERWTSRRPPHCTHVEQPEQKEQVLSCGQLWKPDGCWTPAATVVAYRSVGHYTRSCRSLLWKAALSSVSVW